MKIQTVKIDGYKNLSNVKIALSNITALVALNPSSRKFLCLHIFCRHISLYKSL